MAKQHRPKCRPLPADVLEEYKKQAARVRWEKSHYVPRSRDSQIPCWDPECSWTWQIPHRYRTARSREYDATEILSTSGEWHPPAGHDLYQAAYDQHLPNCPQKEATS